MKPEDVLRQYPGPVRLQARVSRHVHAPVVFAAFCAVMAFSDNYKMRAAGIVLGGFFLLYALFNYLRPSRIELDGWGFTTTDWGGARVKARWRDVSEFSVQWDRYPFVVYSDRNYDQALFGDRRPVTNSYPFSAEDMAALMNEWRRRSIGA